MESNVLRVVVTGAAGQIGYSIVRPLALGFAFGPQQPIHLVLFDLERCEDLLKGVALEVEDLASPVLAGVSVAISGEVAFKDADYVVCLAGIMALKEGMTRAMLAQTNAAIYKNHGQLLDKYAKKTVKVLVVANPCNTMCLVLSDNAPSIPRENFTSMNRLDHNRSKAMFAFKLGVSTSTVRKVIIWGNHSSSMVPDPTFAEVIVDGKSQKVVDLIKEQQFWTNFPPTVRERAMKVVEYRKNTSALSSAFAAIEHLHDWHLGTAEGDFVSMAVYSDGSYGTPKGVFFSYPCTCKDGKYEIVKGLQISDAVKAQLKVTGDELLEEKAGTASV